MIVRGEVGGRSWDEFDVYLFDIDGTLIECKDATHYFAFCDSLKMLSGRELTLEGVVAHGNVDTGILRDALSRAKVDEGVWRPRLAEITARMGDFVEAHQDEFRIAVLPHVREVLEHLRRRGAKLGVATGNFERIGRLKLQHAGLLAYFDFGGWSDGFESRTDVFRAAIARARALYGAEAAICIAGDTPADIRAAHENGLPVLAVATGIYSADELMQERPEACVASLADLPL